MIDLIRKAVELADGFEVHDERELRVLTNHGTFYVDYDEQFFLDALAAQLVRQVDVLGLDVRLQKTIAAIYEVHKDGRIRNTKAYRRGNDRTMLTITAIVESGVLDDKEDEA